MSKKSSSSLLYSIFLVSFLLGLFLGSGITFIVVNGGRYGHDFDELIKENKDYYMKHALIRQYYSIKRIELSNYRQNAVIVYFNGTTTEFYRLEWGWVEE
jgi:hypothetical protein